jgi:hypothetical protein
MHTENDTLAGSGGSAAHSVKFARLAVAFAVEGAKPGEAAPKAQEAVRSSEVEPDQRRILP